LACRQAGLAFGPASHPAATVDGYIPRPLASTMSAAEGQPRRGVVAIWCTVDLAEGLLERPRLGYHGIALEQCSEPPPPW
jgi:hypothetical protein